jgi:hypothetical protein
LLSNAFVEQAATCAIGALLVQFGNRLVFPFAKGMNVECMFQVVPLQNFRSTRDVSGLNDSLIVFSSSLVSMLSVTLGDSLDMDSPLMLQDVEGDETMPRIPSMSLPFAISPGINWMHMSFCRVWTHGGAGWEGGWRSACLNVEVLRRSDMEKYVVKL